MTMLVSRGNKGSICQEANMAQPEGQESSKEDSSMAVVLTHNSVNSIALNPFNCPRAIKQALRPFHKPFCGGIPKKAKVLFMNISSTWQCCTETKPTKTSSSLRHVLLNSYMLRSMP
ncbi:unnamed protein product [Ilex paraguariensis]|uniref:Uncharacterized protein n=1 Tax=Ilex paraguariensis TaxID=185542 RepID=A0ABC8SLK1_9AQUA